MQTEHIEWGGWPNCIRISNERVELVVTIDFGPRIISYRLHDKANVLHVAEATLGHISRDDWKAYGGHRLWRAPEQPELTCAPDNQPVQVVEQGDGLLFTTGHADSSGVEKALHLSLDARGRVTIDHLIHNRSGRSVDVASWGLTVMKAGGVAVMPLPPRGTHPQNLLPNTRLIFWPYVDLSDPRWHFGHEFIHLTQADGPPQKFGSRNDAGWLAYFSGDGLFIKQFDYLDSAFYPDMGCNCEIYTDSSILELESLSRLKSLTPDETVSHRERWTLTDSVSLPSTDAAMREVIEPHLVGSES